MVVEAIHERRAYICIHVGMSSKQNEHGLLFVCALAASVMITPARTCSAVCFVWPWQNDFFDSTLNETKVEPWYGTDYTCEAIGDDLIKSWEACGRREELRLPEPNPVIATVRHGHGTGACAVQISPRVTPPPPLPTLHY